MKFFKSIVCIHIIVLIIGIIILITVPTTDKLRWNMGYVVSWTVFITALLISCCMPRKFRFRKLLKIYLTVFWCLPVAALCCMGFYAVYFPLLLKEIFIPPTKITENKQYILRQAPPDVRMRGDCLYMKDGFFEVYAGDIESEEQEGESASPAHLPEGVEIHLLDVSPSTGTVTITCADTILTYGVYKWLE